MTKTDRKIMMMHRIIKQRGKQLKSAQTELKTQTALNNTLSARLMTLVNKMRGDGAKAPVPAEYLKSYASALEWVTRNKYSDGRILAWFKDPDDANKPYEQILGHAVVDWKAILIVDGVYDLEMVKEWEYR